MYVLRFIKNVFISEPFLFYHPHLPSPSPSPDADRCSRLITPQILIQHPKRARGIASSQDARRWRHGFTQAHRNRHHSYRGTPLTLSWKTSLMSTDFATRGTVFITILNMYLFVLIHVFAARSIAHSAPGTVRHTLRRSMMKGRSPVSQDLLITEGNPLSSEIPATEAEALILSVLLPSLYVFALATIMCC